MCKKNEGKKILLICVKSILKKKKCSVILRVFATHTERLKCQRSTLRNMSTFNYKFKNPVRQFIMFAMFHSASLFVANTRWILITLFAIVQRQREERSAARRRAQNQLLYADCRTARNVNSLFLAVSPVYVRVWSPCVCMRA